MLGRTSSLVPVIVVGLLCLVTDSTAEENPRTESGRLKKDLFLEYDRETRPVPHHQNETDVEITMYPTYVWLDEHHNELVIHTYMSYAWLDYYLGWEPSQYSGIMDIEVHSNDVWLPDIAHISASHHWQVSHKSIPSSPCWLNHTGHVSCVPPTVWNAHCDADIERFPYDVHNCSLHMTSWSDSFDIKLRLKSDKVDLQTYQPNREWRIVDTSASVTEENYYCCPNRSRSVVSFNFTVERLSATHSAVSAVPVLAMFAMSLVPCWLPPLDTERLSMGLTNLLVHCLYLQYLGSRLPPNGDNPPLLVLLYRDSLILCGASLLLTILARRLMVTGASPPSWLNRLLDSTAGHHLSWGAKDTAGWERMAVLLDRVGFGTLLLTAFGLLVALVPRRGVPL